MAITQNHVINIQPGVSAPLVIHCSQGDTGSVINLTVVNGDETFDCSSYLCSVHGVRSDGANWGPYEVTVSGSTVSFSLRQEMTAVAGPCLAEITIGTVGTANFAILVENATFSLGVTYTEDVSLYQSILNYIMGAAQDIKTEATASVNKAIDQMNAKANDLQNQYAVTNAKLDTAISAATQDSEVKDIRVKADGTSSTTAGNAVREQITELKNDLGDFKTDVFKERITPSANLFPSQTLTEGKDWNCWTATVYQEATEIYACFEFDIPSGTEYISSNWQWANNSFSAFVNDSYAKIDLIKNTKTSDSGYVYAVPEGATKACISFDNRSGNTLNNKYNSAGIVFVVGIANISTKTKGDYAEETSYFADNLKLSSENEATIPEAISALKSTDTKLSGEVAVIAQQFNKKKNLVMGLNEGEYSIAFRIGDTVTTNSNASYAYGYADVEGHEHVTVNMPSMSDAYSFFTDVNHKKVATSADNRVGTTRVYTVPTDAKYFYVSTREKTAWETYGIVIFDGDADIASSPVSAEIYPYNTAFYFADNLKLFTGGTIGSRLENTGLTFHVEKDGSGDFTNFVEAIQEATKYMDSVVYVGAGTWNIIDEFGSTYMESVTSDPATWGLVLKNRVHVVGTAKTIITAKYTGTTENTRQYFSAFNAGAHGFTLENLEIEADNIRYVMHDDRGNGGQTPYINRYINVSMKLTHGYYGDTALGGGLGVNGTLEIINCRFEGSPETHKLAYYHGNNYGGETGAKCKIIVQGCYFANNGSFDVTKYGDSIEMSTAYLSNNSFGSAPQVTSGSRAPQDNMQIVAWNNEIRTT